MSQVPHNLSGINEEEEAMNSKKPSEKKQEDSSSNPMQPKDIEVPESDNDIFEVDGDSKPQVKNDLNNLFLEKDTRHEFSRT